jgi:hypothetical protein
MKRMCKLMLLGPLVALLFLGCATVGEHKEKVEAVNMAAPVVERPEYIFHRAMPGETLGTIANWYSGKTNRWRELADQNPTLSPWNLKEGDIVKVPVSFAVVHKEQPNYSTAPKPKGKQTRKAPATPKDSTEKAPASGQEVFGPK